MPRKSRKEKEKEDFLEELARELKKKPEEKFETESEEEEEALSAPREEEFDFRGIDFQTFQGQRLNQEDASPVLEAIANAGEIAGPRFVRVGLAGNSGGATVGRNGEDNGATYIPTNAQNGEPKYIESSEQIYKAPEVVDVMEVGRKGVNQFSMPEQGAFFQPSREANSEQQSFERISTRPERVDMQTMGRQNPVEAEKEKYQKYDLHKKSSY